jgi:nuclear transport factor 2 (NTF2) superfamily protein
MQQPDNEVTVLLAEQMQREAERAYAAGDLEAILASFDPDITIIYADFPAIHGLSEARKFIGNRLARQKNYQLKKEFRAITGNIIAGAWSGSWIDSQTQAVMHGRGSEFWTMKNGRIALWEATFNVWADGEQGKTPIV